MTHLFTATALITLIASTPTLADITAKQAWAAWHDQMADSGYDATYDEAMSGGILTINNLIISKEFAKGQDPVTTVLGSFGYRERGDGTVDVIMPTDAPMTFRPESGLSFTFMRHHTGMSYIISGTPDAMTHTVHADEITFTLTEMLENGKRVEDAKIDLALKNLASTAFMKTADLNEVVMDYTIAELTYDVDLKNPEADKAFVLSGSFTDLQASIDVAVPANFDPEEFLAAIDAGFALKGEFGYGGTNNQFWLSEGEDSATGTLSSTEGNFSILLETRADGLISAAEHLSLGSLSLGLDATNSDTDPDVTLTVLVADIKGGFEVLIPRDFDPDFMPAAFDAGLAGKINLSYGAITGAISTKEADKSASGTISVESGDVFAAINRKTFRYGGGVIGEKLSITSPELPVSPIEYSIAEAAFNMLMPMGKSTEPEPFAFQFKIADLWVNDGLWGLIDQTAALPHDPVTVNIDVSGMGNWLVDITNIESEAVRNTAVKGEMHALTLNALQVVVAGANLAGSGDFTFNNDDLETFDGMPAPTGKLDLKLTGANTLIDTLVEMGLLPTDQAMGARMAMGLIMVAGDGEDTLVSTIEVSEDGKVLANGKRLK